MQVQVSNQKTYATRWTGGVALLTIADSFNIMGTTTEMAWEMIDYSDPFYVTILFMINL